MIKVFLESKNSSFTKVNFKIPPNNVQNKCLNTIKIKGWADADEFERK